MDSWCTYGRLDLSERISTHLCHSVRKKGSDDMAAFLQIQQRTLGVIPPGRPRPFFFFSFSYGCAGICPTDEESEKVSAR